MTETDELRRMLDERGVEWMPCAWEPQTETFYKNGDGVAFIAMESTAQNGFLLRTDMPVTPAQAIAATLGTGTCKADETDVIKCWVKCEDKPSTERMELIHVMECNVCGGTFEHVNGSYEFCPRCGRRIEVAE